jgi:YHS domain-containing protein
LVSNAALLTIGLVAFGCGGGQKQSETAAPQSQPPAGQTASQTAQVYPLDWCIVSGEKLGEMGAPVAYTYQGRQIKFCCKGCIKDFEHEPARYLARLDSAVTGQIQQPHKEEEGHGG